MSEFPTREMLDVGLAHLIGKDTRGKATKVRPIGQFYSGMTADESEATNWEYYGAERLSEAFKAMLAVAPKENSNG